MLEPRASKRIPFCGKDATATIGDGAPSPHEDIPINAELFRGAIR